MEASGLCPTADAVAAAGLYRYAREHPPTLGGDVLPMHNMTRTSQSTCAHGGRMMCGAECEKAWRGELRRVEAWTAEMEGAAAAAAVGAERAHEGAAEAATAMRAALDGLLAWELEHLRGYAAADADAGVGGDDPLRAGGGAAAAPSSSSSRSGPGSSSLTAAGVGSDEDLTSGWSDHYAVLRLAADFMDVELKASYRRLSLRMHPDKPGGSMRAFQRVAESYQVLSDGARRRPYDFGAGLGAVDAQVKTRAPCCTIHPPRLLELPRSRCRNSNLAGKGTW